MSVTGLVKLPALMRLALIGAAAVLMSLALAACGSEPPPAPTAAPAASEASAPASAPAAAESDTIKVGILHSLSGTMSISETAVHDAELLAIEEDQRQRRCDGQAAGSGHRRRRFRLANVC